MAENQARRDELSAWNEEMLFMDGYDECLLGVAQRFGMNEVAAYDYDKIIASLMKDGMDEDGAIDFFEFNQIGAWMGDNTPVFIRVIPPDSTDIPPTSHPSTGDNQPSTDGTEECDSGHPGV